MRMVSTRTFQQIYSKWFKKQVNTNPQFVSIIFCYNLLFNTHTHTPTHTHTHKARNT